MQTGVKQGQLRIWSNPQWGDCGSTFFVVGQVVSGPDTDMLRVRWYIHGAEEGVSTVPESDILKDSRVLR
jgi:hypothetical protein